MAWLATDFLADVRDAASLPNSTVPGTDDTRLLRMGDVQMRGIIEGLVRSISEEFYVYHVDLDSPAGQLGIRLPPRAVGAAVRTVDYFAGPTNAQTGFNNQMLRHLERIEPERLPSFQVTDQYQGLPWGFYMEAATINLVPRPAGLGALRVRYQHRSGKLVIDTDTTQVWQITAVAASVVSGVNCWHLSAPSVSLTQNIGNVLSGSSPFETILTDCVASATGAGTVDFPQWKFQSTPQIGDWVTMPGVSPLVQVPEEMEPLVATLTAAALLRSKGRAEHSKLLDAAADEMRKKVVLSMTPRTVGNVRVVTGGIRSRTHGPWGSFRY